jgi:pimeloyl-ACP methyl ester carboxylesterase
MNTREAHFAVEGGLNLLLRSWGTGAPALFLIHGFGDGGFVWDTFVRALSPQVTAVAVDLRGHGDSSWDPQQRYAAEVHSADIAHVLERSGFEDVVLVGHSLGAEIAIRVAASGRVRVRALVIVDGGAQMKASAAEHLAQQFAEQSWHYESVSQYTDCLAKRLTLAERPTLQSFAARSMRICTPQGFELKCDPALRNHMRQTEFSSVWPMLSSVKCPILLVRGAASALLSQQSARQVSQTLDDCTFVVVPRAGHAVLLDNPAGLCRAVQPFLTRLPARRGFPG